MTAYDIQGTLATYGLPYPTCFWNKDDDGTRHQIGRVASDGSGWQATCGVDPAFWLIWWGPFTKQVDVGEQVPFFEVAADNATSGDPIVCDLQVQDYTTTTTVAHRILHKSECAASYSTFAVPFVMLDANRSHEIEFRVVWYGAVNTRVGYTGIRCSLSTLTTPRRALCLHLG